MSQKRVKRERRTERAERPPAGGNSRRAWTLAGIAAAVIVAASVVGGIIVARGHSSPATPVGVASASSGPLSISGKDPVTGREVSLAAFRGKPIVLNVWGSWCTGCKAEALDLARFAAAHPRAQVVGIDTQDTQSGARTFYLHYGWHHPSIYDPHGDIAAKLGLQGTPTTFFLDRRHRVVAEIIGATTLAGFDQGLARALKT